VSRDEVKQGEQTEKLAEDKKNGANSSSVDGAFSRNNEAIGI
jgi:hypothetical protein